MLNVECSMLNERSRSALLFTFNIRHSTFNIASMPKNVPKPPPGNRPLKTLERVLSKAGIGSRTEARSWIGGGRVSVNGRVVRDPDAWADLGRDKITFRSKPLQRAERTEPVPPRAG